LKNQKFLEFSFTSARALFIISFLPITLLASGYQSVVQSMRALQRRVPVARTPLRNLSLKDLFRKGIMALRTESYLLFLSALGRDSYRDFSKKAKLKLYTSSSSSQFGSGLAKFRLARSHNNGKLTSSASLIILREGEVEIREILSLSSQRTSTSKHKTVISTFGRSQVSAINEAIEEARGSQIIIRCGHSIRDTKFLRIADSILQRSPSSIAVSQARSGESALRQIVALDTEAKLRKVPIPEGWSLNSNSNLQTNVASAVPVAFNKELWKSLGGLRETYESLPKALVAFSLRAQQNADCHVFGVLESEPSPDCHHNALTEPISFSTEIKENFSVEISSIGIENSPNNSIGALTSLETAAPARTEVKPGSKRILYYSPFATHPVSHGNRATMTQFGSAIRSMGHTVLLAIPRIAVESRQAKSQMINFWGRVAVVRSPLPAISPESYPYGIPMDGWFSDSMGLEMRKIAIQEQVDVVFCSYVFQSRLLDYIPKYMKKIIDTHDRMTDRFTMLEQARLPREFFSCSRLDEASYLSRADVVIARTPQEKNWFASLVPADRVVTVSHFQGLGKPKARPEMLPQTVRFGIVASANQVNLEIVTKFLDELKRVAMSNEKTLKVTVLVAGAVADLLNADYINASKNIPGVTISFLGFVDVLSLFYSSVDCVVSPVLVGSGINVKTVEAIQNGVPLISTRIGSKGIPTTDPMHQLADVEQVVQAMFEITDLEIERLSQVSQALASDLYVRNFNCLRETLESDQSR